MNRQLLEKAFSDIDGKIIAEAYRPVTEAASGSPERIVHMKKKRIIGIALAAALLLALGTAAYAIAGSRFVASREMEDTGSYSDLSDLPQVEKTVGYPVTAPESFADGYTFRRLNVRGEAVYNENNEIEREYYGVHMEYSRPGSPDRCLDLNPELGPSDAESTEQRVIGGVPVGLRLDRYKFVPEGYEKTDEDLALEETGHYFITFGADEISESSCAFAGFVLDGVEYCLSESDADGNTPEELAAMAAELIAAAKTE